MLDTVKAYVALTNASAFLGSLTLSDASLVMSNWDTLLSATNVTIAGGGVLTCDGPFTNTAMSNRVNLVCDTLFVAAGGAIDVNGKGWAGGDVVTGAATVVSAMGAGKRAAADINLYLGGEIDPW